MADLIIRLVVDPETGKKNVVIGYESDSDALPMEHEEEHRRLVDQLIEGGALSEAELGRVIIERDQDSGVENTDAIADDEELGQRPAVSEET